MESHIFKACDSGLFKSGPWGKKYSKLGSIDLANTLPEFACHLEHASIIYNAHRYLGKQMDVERIL